jgi:hypothetical protein
VVEQVYSLLHTLDGRNTRCRHGRAVAMVRRHRAASSGCPEAWLCLGHAQGAMVVLPSHLFGGPIALASPTTMAGP